MKYASFNFSMIHPPPHLHCSIHISSSRQQTQDRSDAFAGFKSPRLIVHQLIQFFKYIHPLSPGAVAVAIAIAYSIYEMIEIEIGIGPLIIMMIGCGVLTARGQFFSVSLTEIRTFGVAPFVVIDFLRG